MHNKKKNWRNSRCALAIAALLFAHSAWSQTAPDPARLAQARALIDQKKPAEALALLSQLEMQSSGHPEFDYLLGVAALDSGDYPKATIALERVLAVRPEFASARLDLARTYFVMGSLDLARQEFDRLLQQNPTAEGKLVIQRFLDEITKRQGDGERRLGGHLTFAVGHDNNISNTTSNFSQAIQSGFRIPNVEPTGNSIRRKAAFGQVQGALEGSVPISSRLKWMTDLEGRFRGFRQQSAFNQKAVDLRSGLRWKRDDFSVRVDGQAQWYRSDGAAPPGNDGTKQSSDRNSHGVRLDTQTGLPDKSLLLGGVQYNRFRYQTNSTQNTNQWLASLSWLKEWGGPARLLSVASIFGSRDDALHPLNAETPGTDVSRKNEGIKLFLQSGLTDRADLQLVLSFAQRKDLTPKARAQTVDFGVDRTTDAELALTYRYNDKWSLRPALSHTRNTSNIELYRFAKTEYSLSLRRDFE